MIAGAWNLAWIKLVELMHNAKDERVKLEAIQTVLGAGVFNKPLYEGGNLFIPDKEQIEHEMEAIRNLMVEGHSLKFCAGCKEFMPHKEDDYVCVECRDGAP